MSFEDRTLLFFKDIGLQPSAPYYLLLFQAVAIGIFGVDSWKESGDTIRGKRRGETVVVAHGFPYVITHQSLVETKKMTEIQKEMEGQEKVGPSEFPSPVGPGLNRGYL